MNFRNPTGQELLLAHCAWGDALWKGLLDVKFVPEFFGREHYDELVFEWGFAALKDEAEAEAAFGRALFAFEPGIKHSFIFLPPDRGVAAFVHEVGHAVHSKLYPESYHNWSTAKSEIFALLGQVNVGQRRDLEPDEALAFAIFEQANKDNPEYGPWLEEAHKIVAKHKRLPAQFEAVANGDF